MRPLTILGLAALLVFALVATSVDGFAVPFQSKDGTEGSQAVLSQPPVSEVPLWTPSPFSGPIRNQALENFGVVEEGIIYRSAQPTEAGYAWLLDNGFKSIVSLRREGGDTTSYVKGLGFQNYLWLDVQDEAAPTDAQAEQLLSFVSDSRHWPVLIHCKVGLGRTGAMAALIRYAIDGWPMEEALREARTYRNGDLAQSQVKWLNHWAANNPPGSHRMVAPTQSIAQ